MQQPYAGNLSSILYDPYGRVIDTTERDLPGGLDFFYWRPQLFALSQWTSEAAYNHASAHETGDFATSACQLSQRMGMAYCRPPCVHKALGPRFKPRGVLSPTLRSKISP